MRSFDLLFCLLRVQAHMDSDLVKLMSSSSVDPAVHAREQYVDLIIFVSVLIFGWHK
jgi:hypothetical protein